MLSDVQPRIATSSVNCELVICMCLWKVLAGCPLPTEQCTPPKGLPSGIAVLPGHQASGELPDKAFLMAKATGCVSHDGLALSH
jgi:hypothetical protein